jgi:hypothetical protein
VAEQPVAEQQPVAVVAVDVVVELGVDFVDFVVVFVLDVEWLVPDSIVFPLLEVFCFLRPIRHEL